MCLIFKTCIVNDLSYYAQLIRVLVRMMLAASSGKSELVVCQHRKGWVVYRDCRGWMHQLGFFLTPCSTFRQEMNAGIRFRILTSVVLFYLQMLHNMNTNWLMMSGCVPGQSD